MLPTSQSTFSRVIPVEFFTLSHYILGQVKIINTGMMGLLSDRTSAFMEVSEANLARVQTPDKIINYSPTMWVAKARVVAVGMSKKDYVGPASVQRGGYQSIYRYTITLTTTVYELQGELEWPGRFDFTSLMSEGTSNFIIVHNAVLVSTLFPTLHIERPAMLFHRNFLDSLVMTRMTTTDKLARPTTERINKPVTGQLDKPTTDKLG